MAAPYRYCLCLAKRSQLNNSHIIFLQEADLLPVRDAQVPLGGAARLHRVGVQVRGKSTI